MNYELYQYIVKNLYNSHTDTKDVVSVENYILVFILYSFEERWRKWNKIKISNKNASDFLEFWERIRCIFIHLHAARTKFFPKTALITWDTSYDETESTRHVRQKGINFRHRIRSCIFVVWCFPRKLFFNYKNVNFLFFAFL